MTTVMTNAEMTSSIVYWLEEDGGKGKRKDIFTRVLPSDTSAKPMAEWQAQFDAVIVDMEQTGVLFCYGKNNQRIMMEM